MRGYGKRMSTESENTEISIRPDLSDKNSVKQNHARRAMQYIEEHYREKFFLDAVANALYLDKIYLSKCFKESTGTTMLKYHNMVRCKEAARLLTGTDLNIEVIGSMVGYTTPSHFTRIFKKVYSCIPSDYRKRYYESPE